MYNQAANHKNTVRYNNMLYEGCDVRVCLLGTIVPRIIIETKTGDFLFFFFPGPSGGAGGVVRCMLSKSPGTHPCKRRNFFASKLGTMVFTFGKSNLTWLYIEKNSASVDFCWRSHGVLLRLLLIFRHRRPWLPHDKSKIKWKGPTPSFCYNAENNHDIVGFPTPK